MIFEDLEIIRREAGSNPSRTTDHEALRQVVTEKAHKYLRKILWKDVSDIGSDLLVVAALIGVVTLKKGGLFSLQLAPFIFAAIGYAFIASFRFVSRRRQKRREEKFDDSIHGNLQRLIANTDYQIRLKNTFIWWYLLPLVPAFILAMSVTASPWIVGAFLVSVSGIIYWGNRYELSRELVPQRKELESLLATLENGGQTVEIRPASRELNATEGKRKPRIFFALTIAAVVVGLVGWLMSAIFKPLPEPQAPEFDDISAFGETDILRINEWLRAQVERSEYPSLSVAVVRDGNIVYQHAFGFENIKAGRKATPETSYNVASVTKAFTASLAILLHNQGVIDLDQPAVKYLPKDVPISTKPALGATITLRQLASHTSGLPRSVPGPVQSVEGRYELEPKRLYDQLADVTLVSDPGTHELYSNLGFGLLGHVLECATGKPFDQLLQEMVCAPLHLERTVIHENDKLSVATGYSANPRLEEGHSYRERFASSGGLIASAPDLAQFLSAQMKPGVFSSEMLAQLHTPSKLSDGSLARTALGWEVRSRGYISRLLKKNGGRNNCSAWIGFAPEHGVGVAVIANCGEPAVDEIGYWLLERSVPGGRAQSAQISPP